MTGSDVRGRGFADLVPHARARAWIDGAAAPLPAERVPPARATGRVLAADVVADRAVPGAPLALIDGFAVAAEATVGAATFTPLPVAARVVEAGDPMPAGTDAVVAFGGGAARERSVEITVQAGAGDGVMARGALAEPGRVLAARGRAVTPAMLPLLIAAGLDHVAVHGRPRLRVLVLRAPDGDGAMVAALGERSGAAVEGPRAIADGAAFAAALRAPGADLIVAIGRTGTGAGDWAPPVLAEAGLLAHHGIAIQPGFSAALGHVGGVPVLLAPGAPAACLAAFELLGRPLLDRLAGRAAQAPDTRAVLGRKLVSEAGYAELAWVRLGATAEPLGAAHASAATLADADGHVVVAEAAEGLAAGSDVLVARS